ncbi:hypothetical protein ACFPOI_09385 [Nonomuraea angiospora]|uniref:Uncharacterized protein n=1 Tax=Nonomuraea angiospora TaxID=46172 RepID=A0ABR9M9I6_9ACTN|nr:hypothetical protein [Nonomuraea angiospora]MBE1589579.1 hypothetical protein [Nonomuraea angiospora]
MAQLSEDEAMLRGAWRLLRDALKHLAWPAADQVAWLGSAMHPDELALDFDHAYGVSWMPREAGWISDELSGLLDEIDRLTAELTDEGPQPWSAEGLQSHPTWQRLRVLACHALALMPPAPWETTGQPRLTT